MIKRFWFIFFAFCFCTVAHASHQDDRLYRFPDENFVYRTIVDFFEKPVDAYALYHNRLAANNFYGIYAEDIWAICDAGGVSIGTDAGKKKCQDFKNTLVQKYYKYYAVCDKNAEKPSGKTHCETIFSKINVQFAQAKNLATTYAREKYNDDIVCNPKIRSRITHIGYEGAISYKTDFIQCTSMKQNNTHYEFEFSDAQESNVSKNQFVWREFASGFCLIYGGQPEPTTKKIVQTVYDELGRANFDLKCEHVQSCNSLRAKIKHFGYDVRSANNACIISHNADNTEKSGAAFSDDYYAKFNGYTFDVYHMGNLVKSYPAVSGRGKKHDSHRTICQKPEYQSCKEVGPIPAGQYYINQNDIEYWENIRIGTYNSNRRNVVVFGKEVGLPLLRRDDKNEFWGDARVLLHPFDGTNLYGREPNMYVHGGDYAGSAGCIDLTHNIMDFINWFGAQTDFSSLKIVVDYGSNADVCKYCDENDPCEPCRCILPDDVEQKCEYI